MKVTIHDITGIDPVIYDATCEDDCRDETDRIVYRLVVEHDDMITMGHILGVPTPRDSFGL